MDTRQKLGKFGENLATDYLVENNYDVVEKNFKCIFGEIDIIAYDRNKCKKELVFIEVKTRRNTLYGDGMSAIDTNKQKHLYRTIEFYLCVNKLKNIKIRVDGIEIFLQNGKTDLKHYCDIILDKPY